MDTPSDTDPDEEWARAQGVPGIDEPFIQKYLDGRDALVTQEKQQRSDHGFRSSLSPMAAEAAAIVSAIRFEEQQTLWQPGFEDDLAQAEKIDVFPGMMFTLAKTRMERSKLWRIVRRMPKGALLHCHLSAMGDLDWLVERAFDTPGICLEAKSPLATEESRRTTVFSFKFVEDAVLEDTPSIWTEGYRPEKFVPVTRAAEEFPGTGKEGFVQWLKSRVTVTHEESLQLHMGPNAIWTKFISCFSILSSLQAYEPIFRGFLRLMFKGLHEDGVRWVDIRSTFTSPLQRTGEADADSDFESFFSVIEEEIEAFKNSEEGKGFWGARIIWTTIRQLDTRGVVEDMQRCVEMKVLFPDLIGGYDLVGQEDLGRPLADLTPELFWFRKKCMESGVSIPFFFHAGETLGDGDSVDENLFDAILLGTRRIGHAFSLYKHPLLCDMVKDKRILVESCPVSNEVLRLTGSIMSHPLPALLARGIPCSLSNDDPMILGQGANGMSHDFWQALQGWDNLGLDGLASLAESSVRWANFEDCDQKTWLQGIKDGAYGKGVRAKYLKEWAAEFERFCQWVVLEFGAEQDVDTLD